MKKTLLFAMMLFAFAFTAQAANEVTADCGSQVTITATPKEGHHFVRCTTINIQLQRIVAVIYYHACRQRHRHGLTGRNIFRKTYRAFHK